MRERDKYWTFYENSKWNQYDWKRLNMLKTICYISLKFCYCIRSFHEYHCSNIVKWTYEHVCLNIAVNLAILFKVQDMKDKFRSNLDDDRRAKFESRLSLKIEWSCVQLYLFIIYSLVDNLNILFSHVVFFSYFCFIFIQFTVYCRKY